MLYSARWGIEYRENIGIYVYNVGYRLVWGYTSVSTDSKIIVYPWKWWRGTHLCPQDFGVSFFRFLFFYCLNCFKLFYIFCLIVSNWQLITMCIFCCRFNFYFDNFKHYFLCQDTLLCLGLVSGVHYCVLVLFLFKHFSLCLSFFRLLFFPSLKFSNVLPQKITSSSTIVWGYTIVSSCFPEVVILIFSSFPLPFPLLKFFPFN